MPFKFESRRGNTSAGEETKIQNIGFSTRISGLEILKEISERLYRIAGTERIRFTKNVWQAQKEELRRLKPLGPTTIDVSNAVNTVLELFARQQANINQLRLTDRYAKRVNRRTFLVQNIFNRLAEHLQDQREATYNQETDTYENEIFSIKITTQQGVSLSVDFSSLYDAMVAGSNPFESEREKKYIGLHANILFGYRTFVSRIMNQTMKQSSVRGPLSSGLFPAESLVKDPRIKREMGEAVSDSYSEYLRNQYNQMIRGAGDDIRSRILDNLGGPFATD